MQVDISEATFNAIAAREPDVSAFIEMAARKALEEQCPAAVRAKQLADALTPEQRESLRRGFESLRGVIRDTTLEELMEWRREGAR